MEEKKMEFYKEKSMEWLKEYTKKHNQQEPLGYLKRNIDIRRSIFDESESFIEVIEKSLYWNRNSNLPDHKFDPEDSSYMKNSVPEKAAIIWLEIIEEVGLKYYADVPEKWFTAPSCFLN
jgi:hypothetical protein